MESKLKVYPMRLTPGTELKSSLLNFVRMNDLKAVFVMTCCGSLTKVTLRCAQKANGEMNDVRTLEKHFEITSLVGTLSSDGGSHLHITLGGDDGSTVSGHLVGDAIVFTTAEIVLGECEDALFTRELDPATQCPELVIEPRRK